jgi:hypothetical protein
MSAFFNADEHLGDIHEAAVKLAPLCTNGVDWSNSGGESRYGHAGKSDVQIVAERAWDLGSAFVEQYYRKIEEAGVRAAAHELRLEAQARAPKREAANG